MNICGICKKGKRDGDQGGRIRLAAEDMRDEKYPAPKEPGLYSCCGECLENYLPIVGKRLGHTVGRLPYNHEI